MSKAVPRVTSAVGGKGRPAKPSDKLKAERVELALKQMPEWRLQHGGVALARRVQLGSPGAALAFAGLVTSLAERLDRQPRIVLQGSEVQVVLMSLGGLTRPDLALARRIHGQI